MVAARCLPNGLLDDPKNEERLRYESEGIAVVVILLVLIWFIYRDWRQVTIQKPYRWESGLQQKAEE